MARLDVRREQRLVKLESSTQALVTTWSVARRACPGPRRRELTARSCCRALLPAFPLALSQ
eukprot:251064-Chlamydomonas_euryale.AAC.2